MNAKEIIRCVDDGANFYLRFFGEAAHMEYRDNGYYTYIRPKEGERGVAFAFDIRLENLPEDAQIRLIDEIKALRMPVWWGLQMSGRLHRLVYGGDKKPLTSAPGDELYMALLPGELHPVAQEASASHIKKVVTKEDFAVWAQIANDVLSDGSPDIHPAHHFHWCEEGKIYCYIAYEKEDPAAVASVMNNRGICSLEFVATLPAYRRKGLSKRLCAAAAADAFANNAKIVTLRAFHPGTRELYESLGFQIYNEAV